MRHGRGAEARRADRIHVTLTKDLRQALSYLTRLTYHLNTQLAIARAVDGSFQRCHNMRRTTGEEESRFIYS